MTRPARIVPAAAASGPPPQPCSPRRAPSQGRSAVGTPPALLTVAPPEREADADHRERRDMNTRQLGDSDLHITPIGFGAWAIGGPGWAFAWGDQDDRESIAAIRAALGAGVNWIDTAAVYGLGHSEEVV